MTMECSCKLCPSPGMYAVTSNPFVRRTRHTLRRAEFGFFGVVVYTRVHTPRFCGAATFFLRPLPDFRPGVASFLVLGVRPLRTSCEVVGMRGGQDSSGPVVDRRPGARIRPAPQGPTPRGAPCV